jgi:transcriptional regulator with XRE-family HTH domain
MSAIKRTQITGMIGHNIRQIRLSQGKTQEQLAGLATVDRGYLGQIEGGNRNVGVLELEKIVGALGVDICALFKSPK